MNYRIQFMKDWHNWFPFLDFADCSSIQTVSIPSSLPFISHYTFNGKYYLYSIHQHLVFIFNLIILGCSSLISVVIPTSVTAIGALVFYGECNIQFPYFLSNWRHTDIILIQILTIFTLTHSVKGGILIIILFELLGCGAMLSVTIPTTVIFIDNGAFQCENKFS